MSGNPCVRREDGVSDLSVQSSQCIAMPDREQVADLLVDQPTPVDTLAWVS